MKYTLCPEDTLTLNLPCDPSTLSAPVEKLVSISDWYRPNQERVFINCSAYKVTKPFVLHDSYNYMGNFFHRRMCIMYAVIMNLCNVYVYKLLGIGMKRCLKLALNTYSCSVYKQFRCSLYAFTGNV